MNGIRAAFTGYLSKDAEVRNTRDDKPWLSFTTAVDATRVADEGPTWLRAALFGDTVEALAPRLTKGTEIYCEGRLTLRPWTDADGKKAGLSLTASLVQPMGQIGRRPRVRDEREAV